MSRLRVLFFVRRGIVGLALVALGYLYWRFEVIRLPSGSCSPLMRFAAGSALVVDKHPPSYDSNDAVFFVGAGGGLFLGLIDASRDDGYWIVTDNPRCEGRGSNEFGAIIPDALRGRILFALASR